jgi:ABC-type antimicrobial peptide transport system permease subunit
MSRMRLRKWLTLFQLIFSLIFIITTALIYRQLNLLVNFDYGFRTQNVVNIELQGVPYATLKGELMSHSGVVGVGATSLVLAGGSNNGALDPVHPVEYERYSDQLHDNEVTDVFRDLANIVGLGALIAITIACLGLTSMAAFNTELRTKEIGIRKVLGAGVRGLVWLLSREYVYLAAVAIVIASPASWLLNSLWLEQLGNRATFGPTLIGLSAATLLAMALLAVGFQTLRATAADPLDSLRRE